VQLESSFPWLRVVAAPADRQPFPIEVLVVEEDSYLVLGADTLVREPSVHPLRLLHQLRRVEPVMPGSVVVREGVPMRLLAIVHHLARRPSWSEEWIAEALDGVVRHVITHGIRSIGLPPLGSVHGRLPVSRFMHILERTLATNPPEPLRHLWLAVPPRLDLIALTRFRANGE
jgi:hypothetical protein